jgi:transforming growth factor-beta-induced protein
MYQIYLGGNKMKKILSLLIAFAMVLSSTSIMATEENIVEIAGGNSNFSILVAALEETGLDSTLEGDGPFTVFAPTNDAFTALLAALDITAEELLEQPDLSRVLLYHVISGSIFSSDLTDGAMPATLNGQTVTIDLSSGVMVNDANVIIPDVEASNGVIHIIDSVLVPSDFELEEMDEDDEDENENDDPAPVQPSIVDIASGNPDFSILVAALGQADLVDTLQGEGPFTVFAPTNDAFTALLNSLNITSEQLLAQPDLAKVLLYHVVGGNILSTDLTDGDMPDTLNGQTVTVDLSSGVKINSSNVIIPDLVASNGVIHVIDQVLVPSNFTLQIEEPEPEPEPEPEIPSFIQGIFNEIRGNERFDRLRDSLEEVVEERSNRRNRRRRGRWGRW